MSQVVLYSAPGCHLCEEAARILEALQRAHGFELREVDIHSDPDLERLYLIEIPVIEVDGVVLTSGRVDFEVVRTALGG